MFIIYWQSVIDIPSVARAVHERVQPPVEQTVFTLQSANPHRTRRVVNPAASVRSAEPVELSVRFRWTPFPTPFCTRNSKHGHQISLSPFAEIARRKNIILDYKCFSYYNINRCIVIINDVIRGVRGTTVLLLESFQTITN